MISSCKKAPNYPVEPSIEFKDQIIFETFQHLNDSLHLIIRFRDGDGDLGNDPATEELDFIVEIEKKQDGIFAPLDSVPLIPFGGHLPLLAPYTVTGPIDGTITQKIDFFDGPGLAVDPGDTVRFTVRIKDRANHYSNLVTFPEIIAWKD